MAIPTPVQSSAQLSLLSNPALLDTPGRRLGWAILASLVGNLLLWRGVAAMARQPLRFDTKPVEVTRIILAPNNKRVVKVIAKKPFVKLEKKIEKKIAKPIIPVRKEIIQPKVRVQTRTITPPPRRQPQPAKRTLPPPETAHNRIITAPDTKVAPPPNTPVVQSGGKADLGKPVVQQGTGDAKTSPDVIVKKEAPKQPDAPKVVKEVAAPPRQAEAPKQPDPPKQPDIPRQPDPPKQPDPPRKKGPTKDAEPVNQINPNIPDELKKGDFKSFVRVAVDIDADGSFTVTLRTSSGNQDIDNRVLEALKKWKWKPALKNGEPVQSVQRFKFEFEVQ